MSSSDFAHLMHTHSFGQQELQAGERRTAVVVVLTAVMMVAEIISGVLFGSMALLADGLHMASHAAALGVSWAAYVLARRFAADSRYSFGSGKMNSLAAYTSAVMLGLFTTVMLYESIRRFVNPVSIAFDQAILVAVLGLIVNGISVWILQGGHEHRREHHHVHEHDHNLKAAYFHVLADALTSLLAIIALMGGKYLQWNWLDPLMGIVGAVLVARWAVGLAFTSSRVLLDRQASDEVLKDIRSTLEADERTKVTDLHVWSIGPGIYAAAVAIVTASPRGSEHYRAALDGRHGLVHITVEVHESKTVRFENAES
jgi:cation diffusion facilitator family transporter